VLFQGIAVLLGSPLSGLLACLGCCSDIYTALNTL